MVSDDVLEAAELIERAFESQIAHEYSRHGCDTFREFASAKSLLERLNPAYYSFVAIRSSRLVGMAQLKRPTHITMVFVDPSEHRQGTGRLLWQALRSCALTNNYGSDFSVRSSAFALPYYTALGFVQSGISDSEGGIVSYPMVHRGVPDAN